MEQVHCVLAQYRRLRRGVLHFRLCVAPQLHDRLKGIFLNNTILMKNRKNIYRLDEIVSLAPC